MKNKDLWERAIFYGIERWRLVGEVAKVGTDALARKWVPNNLEISYIKNGAFEQLMFDLGQSPVKHAASLQRRCDSRFHWDSDRGQLALLINTCALALIARPAMQKRVRCHSQKKM